MNYKLSTIAGGTLIAAGLGMALLSVSDAAPDNLGKILYDFAGAPDGAYPNGDLIVDDMGVFYGTTSAGGVITAECSVGCGTVYKIADGVESVIYRFSGISDGAVPYDGLLLDAEGNLYGVTQQGGGSYMGTVFKISPDGSKTMLHSFAGGTEDGVGPNGDLIADAEGNLYGTTHYGGMGDCDLGCGTVFKVTPDGQESVIHAFIGGMGDEGKYPSAGLIADAEGNLYGTTYGGGGSMNQCGSYGCGTIFKVTPDGQTTVLHRFEGFHSAGHPRDPLIVDAEGNFYGNTYNGGGRNFGSIWKVSADGATETVLYSFRNNVDSAGVGSGLVADAEGNLFGTVPGGGENLHGIVYRLSTGGRLAVLYTFPDVTGLSSPTGRMIIDGHGNLIGATIYSGIKNCGSYGCGSIFQVKE